MLSIKLILDMVPLKRLYVKVLGSIPELNGSKLTEIELYHRGVSIGKTMLRVLPNGTLEGAYDEVSIE